MNDSVKISERTWQRESWMTFKSQENKVILFRTKDGWIKRNYFERRIYKKIRDATISIINTETSHIACMQRYVGQV
jgi:hypothetical protein